MNAQQLDEYIKTSLIEKLSMQYALEVFKKQYPHDYWTQKYWKEMQSDLNRLDVMIVETIVRQSKDTQ